MKKSNTKKATAPSLPSISEAESDRRLRPVMDAYYSRNSKHALKLVNQALQKRPGWPAARALRACINLQVERYDVALEEVDEIYDQIQTNKIQLNEDTIKKLHIYYIEVKREDIVAQLYEMLWKLKVTDISHAETSFCLYIRSNAFSSAQKLAMKLQKLFTSSSKSSSSQLQVSQKYIFWATCALWLNIVYQMRSSANVSQQQSNSQQMDNRMLKLGCAMMSKALKNSVVTPTAEMVRFAMRVFKQSADYNSAIQLISNPRLVMDQVEMLHLRGDISYNSTKDPSDYETLLTKYNSNDWGYWLRLFESLKCTKPSNWVEQAQRIVDGEIEKVKNAEQDEKAKSKEPPRGVYLANMELLYKQENWNSLSEAVLDYFGRFGSKAVVTRDLRPWITLLKEQGMDRNNSTQGYEITVLTKIQKIADQKGFPYHMHLCWLKLWFGMLDETPELLIKKYLEERSPGLESTDRQPGDDYLILAAQQLLPFPIKNKTFSSQPTSSDTDSESTVATANTPEYLQSNISSSIVANFSGMQIDAEDRYKDSSAVLKAIVLLEVGLQWSPCNHDFKLLLLRLYNIVGGIDKMSSLWESLQVKHVQLSTLTHIVLRPFFNSGHHQPLQIVIDRIDSLWKEIEHEIPECISRAFQEGSLNSAVDFVLFKLRLERSVILVDTMVIDALLQVIMTSGESIGIKRALDTLTTRPKFSLDDLDGSKRIVCNEDTMCYRFWDCNSTSTNTITNINTNTTTNTTANTNTDANNTANDIESDTRSEALSDEFLEQGANCEKGRIETLRAELTSMITLLKLTLQNGSEGMSNMDESENVAEIKCMISNETVESIQKVDISHESKLRLKIAKNLVNVWLVLQKAVGSGPNAKSSTKTNGGADKPSDSNIDGGEGIETPVESLIHEGRELIRQLGQMVNHAVGDDDGEEENSARPSTTSGKAKEENTQGSDKTNFHVQLDQCCQLTFNILLLVGVTVSSFSPILMKGNRKVKKAGSNASLKNTSGSSFSVETFEGARKVILMYREEIIAATERLQEWVTKHIDKGVNWANTVVNDNLIEDITNLIPDEMCTEAKDSSLYNNSTIVEKTEINESNKIGKHKDPIDRKHLCKEVIDSIKSSQSVSCSSLLESLTTVTRRLQLADL